jgi:hypothetical protein
MPIVITQIPLTVRGDRISPVRGFAIGNGDKLARLVFVVRRGERRNGVSEKKQKERYPPKRLCHDAVEIFPRLTTKIHRRKKNLGPTIHFLQWTGTERVTTRTPGTLNKDFDSYLISDYFRDLSVPVVSLISSPSFFCSPP